MSEPVIACSLDGDGQAKRLQEIAELRQRALLEARETPAGLRMRFSARPGIREELEQLIEIESRCCSFLRFELDCSDEELVLEVGGPEQARPLIEGMFGFTGAEPKGCARQDRGDVTAKRGQLRRG
jgi:hypothetical protein